MAGPGPAPAPGPCPGLYPGPYRATRLVSTARGCRGTGAATAAGGAGRPRHPCERCAAGGGSAPRDRCRDRGDSWVPRDRPTCCRDGARCRDTRVPGALLPRVRFPGTLVPGDAPRAVATLTAQGHPGNPPAPRSVATLGALGPPIPSRHGGTSPPPPCVPVISLPCCRDTVGVATRGRRNSRGRSVSPQWNEVTRRFRAGMPLRRHRQRLRSHGSCFTAAEAADWLHPVLRSNSSFGPDVTRQQTVQLLRKFLKNHVIEDIKGRWGAENLEDNGALYRFPPTSPVKPLPSPPRENLENFSGDKGKLFKLPSSSKRGLKKQEFLQSVENITRPKADVRGEKKEGTVQRREISQEYVQETWRNIIQIHLQTILGLPSLEEVLQPAQIIPEFVMYNMSNTSKHGVVILQDKAEDLPHWVLSAMKCLAYWPRNNDMSQATYSGFERDVFRTVADYFLSLPEPLLTFEYYELFVNTLVLCGCIQIPDLGSGNRSVQEEKCDPQPSKPPHLNSFKSTECLPLSLLLKESDKKEKGEASRRFSSEELRAQNQHRRKWQQHKLPRQQGSAGNLIGGSCQNLAASRNDQEPPGAFRTRCYSLERVGAAASSVCGKGGGVSTSRRSGELLEEHRVNSVPGLGWDSSGPAQGLRGVPGPCPWAEEPWGGSHGSLRLLGRRSCRSCSAINRPSAEITVQPLPRGQGTPSPSVAISVQKRLCRSSTDLSGRSVSPSPCVLVGTNLLQPHLERIAVEALQICCLLLPPPRRRKLQLLLRMVARISGNVDMPRLHDAMGNRSLLIQTFSRCVLRCAEEEDLDELLSTRLLSFLMDHQQEIFQVPVYLQVAVQDHLKYMEKAQCKQEKEEICAILPTYSYCKQITPQEFEEQKVSTSQAAVAELLENIIKDKNLSVKDKKKKLKQFQKEYPQIYGSRFPRTEAEAQLLENKPTLKQPLLSLRKPKFRSLRSLVLAALWKEEMFTWTLCWKVPKYLFLVQILWNDF
uniref:DEP domain-containing protein n=1 Tax=Taeniopygia guttata TaxID=59729 RepID=A0A674H7E8_TAEGU